MRQAIEAISATVFLLFFQHSYASAVAEGAAVAGRALSVDAILQSLDKVENRIDNELFLFETPSYQWIESSVYRYADFRESLHVMATEGVAEKRFYIGENDVENGHVFGLVNIAAFLAQSMKETIRYDACGKCLFGLFAACARVGSLYLLMYELDD